MIVGKTTKKFIIKGEKKVKSYNSLEELQKDETLKNMGRYGCKKVELKGEKVYACTTNQQYEDIIWGGTYDVLEKLLKHFGFKTETNDISITDLATDVRDYLLSKLEEKGIKFVDVFDEY